MLSTSRGRRSLDDGVLGRQVEAAVHLLPEGRDRCVAVAVDLDDRLVETRLVELAALDSRARIAALLLGPLLELHLLLGDVSADVLVRALADGVSLLEEQLAAQQVGEQVRQAVHLIQLSLRRHPSHVRLALSKKAEHDEDRELDKCVGGRQAWHSATRRCRRALAAQAEQLEPPDQLSLGRQLDHCIFHPSFQSCLRGGCCLRPQIRSECWLKVRCLRQRCRCRAAFDHACCIDIFSPCVFHWIVDW